MCWRESNQEALIWQGVVTVTQPGNCCFSVFPLDWEACFLVRREGSPSSHPLRWDAPPSLEQHINHRTTQWPVISLLASETRSLKFLSLLLLPAPVHTECQTQSMSWHSHTQKKHRSVITYVLDAPVPTSIRKLSKEDKLYASLGRSYHIPDTAKWAALVGGS